MNKRKKERKSLKLGYRSPILSFQSLKDVFCAHTLVLPFSTNEADCVSYRRVVSIGFRNAADAFLNMQRKRGDT